MMKIVIVVPLYNEGQRAVETVEEILKNTKSDIVCVDDGSKDKSFILLKNSFKNNKRVTIIRHKVNLGKGAAMKTGAEMAWKKGAEAIIFIDADGQHDPRHLAEFEKELINNDIVFGYRVLGKDVPVIRKYGNKIAGMIVRILFNIKRRDLLCGFIGLQKTAYYKLLWSSDRYGVETEMTSIVGKYKLPFKEIKVDTIYLDKYKGVTLVTAMGILCKIPYFYFKK